jgi:hypothetical protein
MSKIWLLRGDRRAPGWGSLEAESKAGKADIIVFDRDAWALVRAEEPPQHYDGLTPEVPRDGLYISTTGLPCYIAAGHEAPNARAVLAIMGEAGQKALVEAGDPDEALMKLGLAF